MYLPNLIFVGGKKLSGKDFICDSLARYGFKKVHIVEPWLRHWSAERGIDYDTEYLPNKGRYRAQVQEDAVNTRQHDPEILLRLMDATLAELKGQRVAVTGVRFINEVLYGIYQVGALVVKVETPDEVRRARFIAAGENLELFNDPFEAEIDRLPHHLTVEGIEAPQAYPFIISAGYRELMKFQGKLAA